MIPVIKTKACFIRSNSQNKIIWVVVMSEQPKKNSPMVRNSNKTIPKSITMDTIIINITTKISDYQYQ